MPNLPNLERNELGQVVVPAKPSMPPRRYDSEIDKKLVEYLIRNGWEERGGVWYDPLSAGSDRGVRQKTGELPDKEGKKKDLFQVVCPPIRWRHPLDEAVNIQVNRDEAGKQGEDASPITRLNRLGQQVTEMLGKEAGVAQDLERLLQRMIPKTEAGLAAELTVIRRAILEAAKRLRSIEHIAA